MNLLLLEDGDFVAEDRVRLSGRRLKHLLEVHRAEAGDSLRVGRLNGLMGSGQLISLDSEHAELSVQLDQPPPAKLPLTLLLALPRPKMLRRVLQTVSSMGVPRLVLLNSYRVEKSFWQTPFLEPAAIHEQLILGLEQARGRGAQTGGARQKRVGLGNPLTIPQPRILVGQRHHHAILVHPRRPPRF